MFSCFLTAVIKTCGQGQPEPDAVVPAAGRDPAAAGGTANPAAVDPATAASDPDPASRRIHPGASVFRRIRIIVVPAILHPLKDSLIILNLALFLRKHPFHIVHTHNSKAGFVGRLAAKLARVPVIVHTVHGFSFHEQELRWRQWLFRSMERLASRWCDQLIFISQPLMTWALREGIGNKERMTRIYSGIELDRFQPVSEQEKIDLRKKWGLEARDLVVGIVSKLWDGKGHALLLDAFQEIRRTKVEAKLVIVGEGCLLKDLRGLVDKHAMNGAVLFTGFQSEVAPLIATFDVAVLPSFFEGMGRVLLEAMAMGKPVVASRVGGIPDLVEHGVNGYLVRPGHKGELKEAILRLLDDRSLALNMGREGREKVKGEFDALAM